MSAGGTHISDANMNAAKAAFHLAVSTYLGTTPAERVDEALAAIADYALGLTPQTAGAAVAASVCLCDTSEALNRLAAMELARVDLELASGIVPLSPSDAQRHPAAMRCVQPNAALAVSLVLEAGRIALDADAAAPAFTAVEIYEGPSGPGQMIVRALFFSRWGEPTQASVYYGEAPNGPLARAHVVEGSALRTIGAALRRPILDQALTAGAEEPAADPSAQRVLH